MPPAFAFLSTGDGYYALRQSPENIFSYVQTSSHQTIHKFLCNNASFLMCLPVENKKAHPEYRQSLILPYDFRIPLPHRYKSLRHPAGKLRSDDGSMWICRHRLVLPDHRHPPHPHSYSLHLMHKNHQISLSDYLLLSKCFVSFCYHFHSFGKFVGRYRQFG